jgi:hypothetical protein
MQNLKAISWFVVFLFFSCSKDNENAAPQSRTENTWTISGHTYKQAGPITQLKDMYASNSKPFTGVKITTVMPSSNGLFSGVNFIFNTHQAGTYTIKSQKTMISDLNAKYMFIEVINGNLQNQGVGYESVDGNTTAKVDIVNGNFVITVSEPAAMTRVLDTGLNAATSTTFTCAKVR